MGNDGLDVAMISDHVSVGRADTHIECRQVGVGNGSVGGIVDVGGAVIDNASGRLWKLGWR